MLKLVDLDSYHLITIAKIWFCGNIYVDNRAKILPWQMAILEKYIIDIISQSPKAAGTNLDFHILVTGDGDDNEYTVDVFAFIDGMIMDDQNVFNNAFSGIHWGLNAILQTISQICSGLISHVSSSDINDSEDLKYDDYTSDCLDDLPLGGFREGLEKPGTIN